MRILERAANPALKLRPWALLAAVIVLATAAYWPGLGSGFRFDDFGNLPNLGKYGRIDDWQSFWLYITSGFAGPTGRPVSLLSFLLDANDWPADPWPFKRTNLIIHLANGVLVFLLSRTLLSAAGHQGRQAMAAALLAAAIWLLHPLWVSTTLYAVQRMTLLSSFFVLLGLLAWTYLRLHRTPQLDRHWVVLAPLILGGFGLLAVLSKENGALLPLYIAVLEATVLTHYDRYSGLAPTAGFLRWRAFLLGVPVTFVAGYLVYFVLTFYSTAHTDADYTPFERLLTQTRILWEYLYHLLAPTSSPGGLYHDGIEVSTSLFAPLVTLPATAALLAIGVWAWRKRRQYPLAAMAVLFFFAGHLLESTVIQLELYFEHRNYLPAALLFLPVTSWWFRQSLVSTRITQLAPLVLIIALAGITAARAHLWSTPFRQALQWVEDRPQSARVHNHLANYWQETGHLKEAQRLVNKAIELDPDGLPWRIRAVRYDCADDGTSENAIDEVKKILARRNHLGNVAIYQIEQFLNRITSGLCPDYVSSEQLLQLLGTLRNLGPDQPRYQRLLLSREGQTHLGAGQAEEAFQDFQSVVRQAPSPDTQLALAATMASAGYHQYALELLDLPPPMSREQPDWGMAMVRQWYLDTTNYYAKERKILREKISEAKRTPTQSQAPVRQEDKGRQLHD